VRVLAGCPPLVTPTSQIVGSQAVNCVVDKANNMPPFTNNSVQYVNLVKGKYGRTPIHIDPEFRFQICGHREERVFSETDYVAPENPPIAEYGCEKIANSERDILLLELFPAVAGTFLTSFLKLKYDKIESEEAERYRKAREDYEAMSPEEKTSRLMQGLYQYHWVSE
jgi:oxaloacetate decarboxylase alpha subunit/pyruvate carboxylase subunit B